MEQTMRVCQTVGQQVTHCDSIPAYTTRDLLRRHVPPVNRLPAALRKFGWRWRQKLVDGWRKHWETERDPRAFGAKKKWFVDAYIRIAPWCRHTQLAADWNALHASANRAI